MAERRLRENAPPQKEQSIRSETGDGEKNQVIVPAREENQTGESNMIQIAASEHKTSEDVADSLTINENTSLSKRSGSELPAHYLSGLARLVLFGRRLLALWVDQIICFCIFGFFTGPCMIAAYYFWSEAPSWGSLICAIVYSSVAFLALICSAFGWLLATFLFCAKFESSAWQATPGKLLMGLKVVDVHGNRIGYWSSIWRLAVQAIIVGIIYPAVSMWITLSLLATDWGQQEIIGFGPRHIIKTVAPTFAVAICYLVSLFTAKGQTLFDIATHRVVTDDRRAGSLRISRDKLFVRLREALNILTRSRNGKSDKLLMFCFGWVCVSCLLCVGIALLVVYSLGEANRAISESTTTNELGSNPHYANARRWFRNLRNLPYYVTPFPTEEDASKATMLSPRNWSVRTAYGLRLEREGDYGGAFNELSEALSYRIRANNDDIIGTQRYTAREKYPLPYSVSHEPSISELYFKLRILSNRLERYEVAESYLKEARRYRTPK